MMKAFAERTGIAHVTTSAYRPQSNFSERVNASIANMLSNYTSSDHKDWDVMLSSITLALNTQFHRSIDTTPFYLMYARNCVLPGDLPTFEADNVTRVNRWKTVCELAKVRTEKVQKYNKSYYDKKRQEMSFNIGDKVLIYTPKRKKGKTTKLLHCYHGPYTVIDIKSPVVYEIQLSPRRKDVVHVSRMKQYYERRDQENIEPTEESSTEAETEAEPEIQTTSNSEQQSTNTSPTRHRYRTRQRVRNTLFLLTFLILFGYANGFEFIDPIQWKTSDRIVVTEVIPYNFKIDYQNPCYLFNSPKMNNTILYNWCKNLFIESYVNPLKMQCRNYDLTRHKRFAPILIGAIAVIGGMSGVGGYFIFKTRKMEHRINNFVEDLKQIHSQVLKGFEIDDHIKNALKFGGIEINKTQLILNATRNELNSDIALATFLSFKFAEIRLIIEKSTNSNGMFVLSKQFLEILNTSLPCGDECPTNLTTLINCNLDEKDHKLNLGIFTRKPSHNLKVLEAKTFTLYNTSDLKRCHTVYKGPQFVIIDLITNCLSPVPGFETNPYVLYSRHNVVCSKESFKPYNWTITECTIEKIFSEIQLISEKNFNFIYCYNMNITINGRLFSCPENPFKLRIDTNFSINDFIYRGVTTNLYSKGAIFNYSEIANKYINRVKSNLSLDLNDFYREIDNINIKTDVEVLKGHSQTTLILVLTAVIVLTIIIVIYFALRLVLMRQRTVNLNHFTNAVAYETARELVRVINNPNIGYIGGNPPEIVEIE